MFAPGGGGDSSWKMNSNPLCDIVQILCSKQRNRNCSSILGSIALSKKNCK